MTAAGLTGTGTVLTSLAISGSTVQGKLGYPPISISYSGSGNAIDGLSYSNGMITANKTNISAGGGYPPSDYLAIGTCTITGNAAKTSVGYATNTAIKSGYTPLGIVGIDCVYHRKGSTGGDDYGRAIAIHSYYMDANGGITLGLMNRGDSACYFQYTIYVLFRKN